jgi:hypothetical protein
VPARREEALPQGAGAATEASWDLPARRAVAQQERDLDLRAHLLAGRRKLAGGAADDLSTSPSTTNGVVVRCLSRSLWDEPFGDLSHAVCTLLAADAAEGAERERILASLDPRDPRVTEVASLLALEAKLDAGQPGACTAAPRHASFLDRPALLFGRAYDRAPPAPGLLSRLTNELSRRSYDVGSCPRLAELLADAAAFLALTGDHVAARQHAARARAVRAREPSGERLLLFGHSEAQFRLLEAAIALLGGDAGPIEAIENRNHGDAAILAWIASAMKESSLFMVAPVPQDDLWQLDLRLPLKVGVDAALGNAFTLEASAGFLPRVAHRIATSRAAALESLAAVARDACTDCDPYRLAIDLARRRDLAAALGDQALAARFEASAARYRTALARRDLAVPLFALRLLP